MAGAELIPGKAETKNTHLNFLKHLCYLYFQNLRLRSEFPEILLPTVTGASMNRQTDTTVIGETSSVLFRISNGPVPGKWDISASGLKRAFGSDCGFIYFLRLLITTRRSQSRPRVERTDRGARLSRIIKCENVDKLIVSAELAGNMGSR